MKTKLILFLAAIFLFQIGCLPDDPKEQNGIEEEVLKQVAYGNHPLQNMDIYLPKDRTRDTKVVIMVHGGGWVMGYKPDGKVTTFSGRYGWNILDPLLDRGYAIVVMKYRTACYNTQPDEFSSETDHYQNQMMEDLDLVIDYMKDNASTLKLADNHFQLIGESAGGHIVMTYGIRNNSDPALKSVVPMFGPTDLDAQDFKTVINTVPLIMATPPNYFMKKSEDCESVTNKQVKVLFSLKSFANHGTININEPNSFLDVLSPAIEANIQRNIPMFITHGMSDELVPYTQAEKMFASMQSKYSSATCADGDFDCQLKLGLYENCGHGWTGGNCDKNKIMDDIVAWIEAH